LRPGTIGNASRRVSSRRANRPGRHEPAAASSARQRRPLNAFALGRLPAMQHLWGFSAAVSEIRQRGLVAIADFAAVVARVVEGTVVRFAVEPRQNPPCLGAYRAVFRLRVAGPAYDAFFNSPVGYRAQYSVGVEQGEQCNRELIAALTPQCLAFAEGQAPSYFSDRLIAASLGGQAAKIWIDETDLNGLEGTHITFQPWVAKAAAATGGTWADMAARSKAESGILAPVGAHLELKGAWIMPDGSECRDPAKEGRSREIHEYGFS
jgi:hypothetical protein